MQNGSLTVIGLAPDGSAAESGLVSVEDVLLKAVSLCASCPPPHEPMHARTCSSLASLVRITNA